MSRVLLDTHVWIWWIEKSERLPQRLRRALKAIHPASPAYISDMSLWEAALLANRGRIQLNIPIRDWLEGACAPPLIERVAISPAIAAEAVLLPNDIRDPADRIIVASARIIGAKLATCDEQIIDAAVVAMV